MDAVVAERACNEGEPAVDLIEMHVHLDERLVQIHSGITRGIGELTRRLEQSDENRGLIVVRLQSVEERDDVPHAR